MQTGPVGPSKKTSDYAKKYEMSKWFSGTALALMVVSPLILFGVIPGEKLNETKKWALLAMAVISTFAYWLLVRYQCKKYHACPYCDKMYVVKYDWQCDYCHETQGEERLIIHHCVKCSRKLESFICPHCQEEFNLYADKS